MSEITIAPKDIVIYNGNEIEVEEVIGDTLILADKKVVTKYDISLVSSPESIPSSEDAEEIRSFTNEEKASLRRRIEEINEEITAIELFSIVEDIGITTENLPTHENGRLNVESLKSQLLTIGVQAGKIDPKICESCGQVIKSE